MARHSINELNINGVQEIAEFVGTRTDIYNRIAKHNPMAIVDYRNSYVAIGDKRYLVVLKRIGRAFGVKLIWRLGSENDGCGTQFWA